MANQTVSTNLNYDSASISGLLNGEDITIDSGATLTFDGDTRWGQQAAVIGRCTISSTTGGAILMDGTKVWWIPYDAATGNVPSLGTVGTPDVTRGGSNVGEFLGVWTALGVAPSAAGGAMPATGFVKLRTKSVDFADNDVLTFANGATITINSATGGQRGWLHIAMEEIGSATSGDWEVPRLGSWTITGDWWEVGTTDGNPGQTFQLPWADRVPGVWIETGTGTNAYEFYPALLHDTTNLTTSTVGTLEINKFVDCTTGGLLRIGNNGTNNIAWTPPSGRRIRVPNIMFSSSTSTDWTANIIGSTSLGNRARTDTANAGTINWDKVIAGPFYLNLVNAYAVSITNAAFSDSINISNVPTAVTLTNVGVSYRNIVTAPINIANLTEGGTLTDIVSARNSGGNPTTIASLSNCVNLTVVRGRFTTAHTTRRDTVPATFSRMVNLTMTDTLFELATLSMTSTRDSTFTNLKFDGGRIAAQTSAETGVSMTDCSRLVFDGVSSPGLGSIPYPNTNLLRTSTGACSDIEIKNIGTAASPLNLSGNITGAICSFTTADFRITVRRCYFQNAPTFLSSSNAADRVNLINCWADGADTQVVVAAQSLIQGCRFTNSTTGQTAVYGSHWLDAFTSTTAGRIVVMCNEPTANTADQCAVTAGTPKFNSVGQVIMPTVGDQVEWTMPYFARGITSLANIAPTLTGTNTGNMTLEFQYDTGSGFNGSWLALTGANLSGVGAITPATGIKLKIRATTATANATNALTYIRLDTVTNSTDQQIQYPLPGVSFTLTGLVAGSEIRAYVGTDPLTATLIDSTESSGTSWTFTHSSAGSDGFIVIRKTDYKFIKIPVTYSSSATTVPVQQQPDRVYANP